MTSASPAPSGRSASALRTSSSDACTLSRNASTAASASSPSGVSGGTAARRSSTSVSVASRPLADRRLDGRARRAGLGDRLGRVAWRSSRPPSARTRCSSRPRPPTPLLGARTAAASAAGCDEHEHERDDGGEPHAWRLARQRRAGGAEQGDSRSAYASRDSVAVNLSGWRIAAPIRRVRPTLLCHGRGRGTDDARVGCAALAHGARAVRAGARARRCPSVRGRAAPLPRAGRRRLGTDSSRHG